MKKAKEFIDSHWYRKNAAPFAIGLCLGLFSLYLIDRVFLK